MRALGSATTTHLSTAEGIAAKRLVWVQARNTATDTLEHIRFWTGDTDTNFIIDGQSNSFLGIQSVIQSEPVEYAIGTDARRYQVTISGVPDAVEVQFRALDLQSAPMSVYGVVLNPVAPVSEPWSDIKGTVDGVRFETGAEGQPNKVVLTVATTAMYLARGIDRKWSDATQRRDASGVTPTTSTMYVTSQTVALGANSAIELTLLAGQNGENGMVGRDELPATGGAGGASTCVVKDSGGATIHTYTATGATPLTVPALTDANNGSVVLTVGAGGAGGVGSVGVGANGAAGSILVSIATTTPVPDAFFQYTATAGDIPSKWA